MASRQRNLRFCLLQRGAGSQTGNHMNGLRRAIVQVACWILPQRCVDFRLVSIQLESGRRDANNRVLPLLENYGAAENISSSVKAVLPETVAKDRHWRGANSILLGHERATKGQRHARHGE